MSKWLYELKALCYKILFDSLRYRYNKISTLRVFYSRELAYKYTKMDYDATYKNYKMIHIRLGINSSQIQRMMIPTT